MIAISITDRCIELHEAISQARTMLGIYAKEGSRLVLSYHTSNGIIDIYMSLGKYGAIETQYEQANDYKQIPLDMRQAEV